MTNYAAEFCYKERKFGFDMAAEWMQSKLKIEPGGENSSHWSDKQTETLISMLAEGKEFKAIANAIGKTTVQIYAKRRKLIEKGLVKAPEETPSEAKQKRVAKFKKLRKAGVTDVHEIAKQAGCNESSIYSYAKAMGYEINKGKVIL
ncbi:hypothetical protein PUV52_09175 [Leuconostoc mesenteroides]|uniref:Uncharacterized protein n=1 Tax=Leuconostoc mesenteroides subsp. mesenteroides (strain ATCC 8293 / DSM 20343 / BCRC 11652 / CCM 1803 / JCM 6124 / NCDO 523 / NBRC 100496 / NCIMB 8023 / NCTC 12954 / NRRL B-1118 / 37Y) TaxID=203120 RepID=Q03VL6_LEUMM|nr:hypothetical protein [Leuconostoc mesenteroides]ABJ62756.1 hypothetical protein LEUM_1664 [Leuconostoc mesenteroides subsp. mesenteroides ATCC 8293]MCT3042548.1 hypothetical protein [Leuconostoc mesenteroides]MDG9747574.1 hypothetical protein [Leuconostoc mesenteroides]QQB30481.1 hypothetical protein I6H90_06445 [Leuconostoc mesenteroides]SPE14641.1 hypothetical protein LEM9268_01489 [Leuconostoc mesenteroides]